MSDNHKTRRAAAKPKTLPQDAASVRIRETKPMPRKCACGNLIKLKSKLDKCVVCASGRREDAESEADRAIDYMIFGRS